MKGRVLIIAGSDSEGRAEILVSIEHPPVIAKILTHLGLSARAPPRSPARAFALFPTA